MLTHRKAAEPSGVRVFANALVGAGMRRAAIGMAALAALAAAPASAQQGPIVSPGQAVVTGYSGFSAYPAPDGGDPFDYMTINTAGPVARVIDLSSPGAQGVPSPAPKTFTVNAGQVGQVFGVALDSAPQPNIYLAATSVYGLSIHVPDGSSTIKRVHTGAPGAQFVPGQFGPPEWGGGPGSIWRVSGATGQVSLFANIGSGNFGSLGGLAFDPATQLLFAADRSSGIVYRLALDGSVKGTYDHGVEGRPNAGLPPVAAPPSIPSIVSSPAFSTDNPATWGLAPVQRRVFALAVHNKRLYYSVAQGPQIWSAGISPSGSIPGKDARIEVEVPSLAADVEIASITFDSAGRMYVAERPRTTGDYYLYNLTDSGVGRVLRYLPKPAGDPTPSRWVLLPEAYSVGLPPPYTNANGGVALNYGYNQQNQINYGACGATVWSTGERLLDPGDGSTPPTYPALEGLQGNLTSAVQPANTPPLQSWFVDFDDQQGQPGFRGYMGAIATIPCAAPTPPPQPPVPPPVVCPPGTYFSNGQCLIFPTCPPGTTFQNGQCVYPQCPPGYVLQGGQCVPPSIVCPPGNVFYQGQCVPLNCPANLIRLPNGFCACPPNTIYANGQCVPPNQCPPGAINLGGICFCPNGLLQGGQCQPFTCPAGQVLTIEGCKPITCPPGQEIKNGQCVPITCLPNQQLWNGQCVPKCPQGLSPQPPNGACGLPPPPPPCLPPNEIWNGKCVPKCPPGQVHLPPNGLCGPGGIITPCFPPNELWNGMCVPKCPPLQVHTPPNGECKPMGIINPPVICLAPNELVNGECKPPCPPLTSRQPDGTCKPLGIINPPVLCLSPNEMVNGECKPPCPPLTTRQPDGTCKPMGIINPPVIDPKPPVIVNPPVLCLAPNEMINGQCKPPCPPLTTRQPDGTCKPMGIINPPPVIIDPPPVFNPDIVLPPVNPPEPPKPISPPLVINPGTIKPINPGLVLPPPGPPPCNPPNQMINGECKPPAVINPPLQINPGILQQLPGLQLQP